MALTIKSRLTLWYLVVFGTILVFAAVALYLTFGGNERNAIDNELRDYTAILLVRAKLKSQEVSEFFADLQEAKESANLRFRAVRIILSMRDSIVYDPSSGFRPTFIDSLQPFLPEQSGERYGTLWADNQEYRVLGVRSSTAGGEGFGVLMVTSLTRLHDRLRRLRNIIVIVVPLALLIAGVGGWLLARSALDPVSRIRQAADAIGSSNLSARVPVGAANDELSELARTFNDMIERIEVTFRAQRRFVADASHDIRTPLMVLGMRINHLLEESDLNGEQRSELEACTDEIDRLGRLASDLLLLARADAHQLQLSTTRIRFDDLLFECTEGLNRLARVRDVALWLDIDDPVEIECDRSQLGRALTNVIENAIKYSRPGGTVRIALAVSDGAARLLIHNDGGFIPEQEIERVFDRFYRGTSSRTTVGSGLGLAISRIFVQAHGGDIRLESGPELGTTVTIVIPLAPHESSTTLPPDGLS